MRLKIDFQNYIYGYEKSILEYLVCKMNLLALFIRDHKLNAITFQLYDTANLNISSNHFIMFNQINLLEILCVLKIYTNPSFVSLFHLFEIRTSFNFNQISNHSILFHQIWITLFIFLVFTFVLIRYLSEEQLNYRKSFYLFIRLLTTQSSDLLDDFVLSIKFLNILKRRDSQSTYADFG